jgi:hypothetical protein
VGAWVAVGSGGVVADNDRDELLRLVSRDYPYPIAQAARRLQAAYSPGDRFDEAFQLGRTLIITLGTLALSVCAHESLQPAGVQAWHRSFTTRTVSLGVWMGAVRDGARAAHRADRPLSGMALALGVDDSALRRDLQALVDLRNQYLGDKSAVRGDAAKQDVLRHYEPRLLGALRGAAFLAEMSVVWVVSSELQRDSGTFRTQARSMSGSDPVFMLQTFDSPDPLLTRTPYLLQKDTPELELTPFLTLADCEACGGLELYYLNRRQGKRFLFSSFTNTHTYQADRLPRELPWSEDGSAIVRGFRRTPSPGLLTDPVLLASQWQGGRERIDLPNLFRATQASLLEALREDEANGWKGWNHHLSLPHVTVWATAVGLRIMRMTVEEFSAFDPRPLLDTLWAKRLEQGGWSAALQFRVPRPEPTAEVLLAMHTYGDPRAREAHEVLESILAPGHDDGLLRHVFSLAQAVPALATVRPDAPVLPRLVAALKDAAIRDQQKGTMCWTPHTRLDPRFDESAPSAALTARTAIALLDCYWMTDGALGSSPSDLQSAVAWLAGLPAWASETTEVRRPSSAYRDEVLVVRHFTSAMVVQALLRLGYDPADRKLGSAVGKLYASHTNGLWNWEGDLSIDRPMWATWEALRALKAYAERATPVPSVEPGPSPSP